MKRQEKAAMAARLRGEGLLQREIAERMGIARSYVGDLLSDPEGTRLRERHDKARGTCVDCGGPTAWSGGRRCAECSIAKQRANAVWTREAIIERIQAWAETYGRVPSAAEWNPPMAINSGRPDWAERFHADGCWPYSVSVQRMFGSWNAGVVAAGFIPRKRGGRERVQPLAVAAFAEAGA